MDGCIFRQRCPREKSQLLLVPQLADAQVSQFGLAACQNNMRVDLLFSDDGKDPVAEL